MWEWIMERLICGSPAAVCIIQRFTRLHMRCIACAICPQLIEKKAGCWIGISEHNSQYYCHLLSSNALAHYNWNCKNVVIAHTLQAYNFFSHHYFEQFFITWTAIFTTIFFRKIVLKIVVECEGRESSMSIAKNCNMPLVLLNLNFNSQ